MYNMYIQHRDMFLCTLCSVHTAFLAPKLLLLASIEAAERGSRRAADNGSEAAEIDSGSCRGSLVGGAELVSFELLSPSFPFFADAVSTDCGEKIYGRYTGVS